MFSTNKGAVRLLVGVVVGLLLLKLAVGWLTGSISIFAQAADSLLDLFAGIITLFAIRIAARPADEEHPYGHGKVEDIAGVAQGFLIGVVGVLIIYSSTRRIIEGTSVELAGVGMGAMLVSIAVSIFLSRHLLKVSRATGSVALEANARNIAADVYSALAVLIGLVAVRLTGLGIIDSIIAIGVAIYILKIAYDTMRKPLSGLVDTKLDPAQEAVIKDCLTKYSQQVVDFHALRTRRAGSQCYIDLHLVMDKNIALLQAHEVCDRIEIEIRTSLPGSSVTIHVEPCNDECGQCSVVCSKRDLK